MKSLRLENIRKKYDGGEVIKGIDATVEAGEFFVLVGPSGCGKSTILRMIAGLEDITEGSLWIDGVYANGLPANKRQLSMVFQNYALFPHLTVEQNITFGLYTKKISKEEQRSRCLETAEMLGLTELLKRKPRQLSGGQRQRVALARAIVTQSPICLMDEPLSNLDAKLRAKMRSEIRQIQRRLGLTMIYVTHDQVEAMTMADRMMILDKGVVQQVGRPLDIYNSPGNTFVASFIGSPPMNLAEADYEDGRWRIPAGPAINSAHSLPGKKGTIGVRPEHISRAEEKVTFFAELLNVEVLGTETLLGFAVGNHQWSARWPGQWQLCVGQRVPCYVAPEHVMLFDKEGQAAAGSFISGPDKGEAL
ncbi:ABC transporter ATP-binding protein [Bacillus testis]|uniref:ABC transporter ATP-binding protein n=1 Tax=Bacillus testis TaxID=1622072 RepID=UPI00067E7791|nr:ATP-binding cassette domain-containing protein [Bacillus testis]